MWRLAADVSEPNVRWLDSVSLAVNIIKLATLAVLSKHRLPNSRAAVRDPSRYVGQTEGLCVFFGRLWKRAKQVLSYSAACRFSD